MWMFLSKLTCARYSMSTLSVITMPSQSRHASLNLQFSLGLRTSSSCFAKGAQWHAEGMTMPRLFVVSIGQLFLRENWDWGPVVGGTSIHAHCVCLSKCRVQYSTFLCLSHNIQNFVGGRAMHVPVGYVNAHLSTWTFAICHVHGVSDLAVSTSSWR